jgi:hypothetical protein
VKRRTSSIERGVIRDQHRALSDECGAIRRKQIRAKCRTRSNPCTGRSDKGRARCTTGTTQNSKVLNTAASVASAGRGVRSAEISAIGTKRQVSSAEQSATGAELEVLSTEQSMHDTRDAKCLRAEQSADRHGASSGKHGAIRGRREAGRVRSRAICEGRGTPGIEGGAIRKRCKSSKCLLRSNPRAARAQRVESGAIR